MRLSGGLVFAVLALWMSPAGAFGAEAATSPSDLARLVNTHMPFDWSPMGDVPDPQRGYLKACEEQACSAELLPILNSRQTIFVLKGSGYPVFYRLIRTNDDGKPISWSFAGAFGPLFKDPNPGYAAVRLGGKPYFTITWQGSLGSDAEGSIEYWIDLTTPDLEPVLTLTIRQTWTNPTTREIVECTESILSWAAAPVEAVKVSYRASLKRDKKPVRSKSVAATFVRKGNTFAFDPGQSTLAKDDRWGEFDVDAVTLLSH